MRPAIHFIIFLLAFLAPTAHAACTDKEVKIVLSISPSETGQAALQHALALENGIAKSLKGKACIEISKGPLSETLVAGAAQLAVTSFRELAKDVPLYGIFDLPFAFRNEFAWQKFSRSPSPFSDALQNKGLTGLGYRLDGFEQMAGKVDFLKPANATGLRFRKVPNKTSLIALLSATAKEISDDELAAALKDGRADAHFATFSSMQKANTLASQKVVTQTNHRLIGGQVLVSTKWWNSLDVKLRLAVGKTIEATTLVYNAKLANTRNLNRTNVLRANPVVSLTRKQRNKWVETVQPLTTEFRNIDGSAAILNLLETVNR